MTMAGEDVIRLAREIERARQVLETLAAARHQDSLKLEASRFDIERRLAYLAESKANLEPIHTHQQVLLKGELDFALLGLKTMAILNGGALFAVPAFKEVFSFEAARWALVSVSLCFAFGLGAAILAILFAYLSSGRSAAALASRQEYASLDVNRSYFPPSGEDAKKHEDARGDAVKQSQKHFDKAVAWRRWGIGSAVASASLFVIGAVVGIAHFDPAASPVPSRPAAPATVKPSGSPTPRALEPTQPSTVPSPLPLIPDPRS